MTEAPIETLQQLVQQHDMELSAEQLNQLDAYCQLLWDWNTKINLTRHTDYDRFVSRDLYDSWQLAKWLPSREEVLDVGSGGGVPGMVLAILRPDLQISLSESVGKKAQVLNRMVESLQLPVAVHACRAEDLLEDFRFDTLVARAVGPLERMLGWVRPHWQNFTRLLAIKGPRWREEQREAEEQGALQGLTMSCLSEYPMPGTESLSVILEIRRPR